MQRLFPTIKLSMELMKVLAKIEYNGIKINVDALHKIKDQYENELKELKTFLLTKIDELMGDTPINLDSPDDRSMLFFSMKVIDKKLWAKEFNIGYEVRGNTRKQKRKTNYDEINDFYHAVNGLAKPVFKTTSTLCQNCDGTGKYKYKKKDGTFSKIKRNCKTCNAKGRIYTNTKERAGLRLVPRGSLDTSATGFKTDKTTLEEFISSINPNQREFLEKYVRYSAIRTYLRTFVDGIEKSKDNNDYIRPQYMQCVTSTGRLSSRNPNFQNMPRGGTFPVRQCIISRWDGGKILEGDYAQLEFRVAGFLADDDQIYADVKNNVDVHSFTAKILGVSRQVAKADTFKPLYGGVLGTPKQMQYYRAFKEKYSGVTRWHRNLINEALETRHITLPSGRSYYFPNTERMPSGSVSNATAIKNYPVQGFATADLLPISLIKLDELLTKRKLKSIICNTVHDSIVLDVYPDEEEMAIETLKEAMLCLPEETQRRYGVKYDMPIGIELKMGSNWLETKEVFKS